MTDVSALGCPGELERSLTLRRVDAGWTVCADPSYESINALFGGWTAAAVTVALQQAAGPGFSPSALSVSYVGRVSLGTELLLRARRLGGGRSAEHWACEVEDSADGRTLVHATMVLVQRRPSDGHTEPTCPEAPSHAGLPVFHPPGSAGQRMEVRPISGHPPFAQPRTTSLAWVRETSGRPMDHAQLAFLADCYAPRSWFWSEGPRPSATLMLAVYFHATDNELALGDDYVLTEAVGTRGADSTSGQQARLWSRSGALLATSEQTCLYS